MPSCVRGPVRCLRRAHRGGRERPPWGASDAGAAEPPRPRPDIRRHAVYSEVPQWGPQPPRLSRVSSTERRMPVKTGTSRSVYRLASPLRRSITRSTKSDGLSVSNPTTNS